MSKTEALPSMPEALDALADTASFTSDEQLVVAGRALMAKHARKLYSHLPGVLTGEDPHDVHQARVATRRLRASLQATARVYNEKLVKQLRKRLRRLARAIGEVRDRDVLLMRLRADLEKLPEAEPERAQLSGVIDALQQERDRAHVQLLVELQHKRTAKTLQSLNHFLLCPLEEIWADTGELPLLVRHHAGSTIWQHFEEVLRFQTILAQASSDQLHELRITSKHLRYTLELFEPALPSNAEDMIDRVKALQEHLGELHDADVAIAYLQGDHSLATTGAGPEHGGNGEVPIPLAQYVARRQEEQEKLLNGVSGVWDSLTLVTPRRKLARLIAEL
jgi:CHAD domain-containing protein